MEPEPFASGGQVPSGEDRSNTPVHRSWGLFDPVTRPRLQGDLHFLKLQRSRGLATPVTARSIPWRFAARL